MHVWATLQSLREFHVDVCLEIFNPSLSITHSHEFDMLYCIQRIFDVEHDERIEIALKHFEQENTPLFHWDGDNKVFYVFTRGERR
jgi:hypothetical protein